MYARAITSVFGLKFVYQVHGHMYPVWASLARDYLAIMASSVSSERAFSSAGITISKRRNRLACDLVEALQVLKSAIREDILCCPPDLPNNVDLDELMDDMDINPDEERELADALKGDLHGIYVDSDLEDE